MDYKLKLMGSLTTHDRICYPYSLQSVDDIVIHRAKLCCEIISTTSCSNYNIQSNLQLTSTKCGSKTTAMPQLNLNPSKVFNNCDQIEKNFIMTHPNFLPTCTAKNVHYIKCLMGPFSERFGYVIACLSTSGCIQLFSFNVDYSELREFNTNLSEIRKANLEKLPREISKFEAYKKILYEVSFSNFEWCPISFEDFTILVTTTKSDEIVFFRVEHENAVQERSIEVEDVGKRKIKWMDLNDEHYLLISTNEGNLIRYSIALTDDGGVNGIEKVDEIKGNIKLPISNIAVDYYQNSTVVLCSKTHSLEIFQFSLMNESKLVLSRYIDMTITGVEVCGGFQYLLSALNAGVHFLKLDLLSTGELALESCTRVEVSEPNTDDAFSCTKYGYYGIATSRNNVLVYLSYYPQFAFDHLSNKQPVRISVNLFTKYDPFEMLMDNQSLKLTDYGDCVEAVRFIGASKLDKLAVLEKLNYDIQLNDEFAYYLKIQLMVVNAKIIFYRIRSNSIVDMIMETQKSIIEIITVLHFYKLLSYLLKMNELSETHVAVIRASSNFIREYCSATIEKEPFVTAAEVFRPQLMELLTACDAIVRKTNPPPEVCDCCEDVLDSNSLVCSSSHRLKRCVVTNLMVSLDCTNFCRRCKENVTELEKLTTVLGNLSGASGFYLCPFCDIKLAFY